YVASCQVGSMLIKDIGWKLPSQRHEAGHLRPCGVCHEKRIVTDIKRWRCAEVSAPHPNGTYVLKVLVQHVRDHAQDVRKFAVCDFVLEVADNNRREVHDTDCFAPIRRSKAG